MAFTKGVAANPNGGTRARRIKQRITEILEHELPLIEKDLETATPEVRRGFFIDLASVLFPAKEHCAQ